MNETELGILLEHLIKQPKESEWVEFKHNFHSVEEIGKHIGVDSLAYISIEGLHNALLDGESKYCKACFDGNYPAKFDDMESPQRTLFDKD